MKPKLMDDYTTVKEKDYTPLIKQLIEALNKNDGSEIKELVNAIKDLSEKSPDIISNDNSDVLHMLGDLIQELKNINQSSMQNNMVMIDAIREIDAPNVNVSTVIEAEKKEQLAYKFDVKRNTANLITEVVATPIRGIR